MIRFKHLKIDKTLSFLIVTGLLLSSISPATVSGDVSKDFVNTVYCSPEGTAEGTGEKDNPIDLRTAISKAVPGTEICLLNGTYTFDSQITIPEEVSGTSDKFIGLLAETPGQVTLDFSAESYEGTNDNDRGIQLDADYWYLYGLKIYKAADNGLYVTGSNNTVDYCVFEANRDSGLQISRKGSTTPKSAWPANNLILNCTSYNNMDITGENADGFAAKLTCGEGNIFDGCIAYCNVDDGWDLYTKSATGAIGSVTLINCIAFRNGQTTDGKFTAEADGNGFKLGGEAISVNHTVVNCIAFENKNHGFTDNSNPGTIAVINCTSFNNSLENGEKANFDFARQLTSDNYLASLISFSTNSISKDKYRGTCENSLFYTPDGYLEVNEKVCVDTKTPSDKVYTGDISDISLNADDFEIITAPDNSADFHSLWRNADGSVNTQGFLKLKADSKASVYGGSSLPDGVSVKSADITFTTDDLLKLTEKETTTRGKLNIIADEEPKNSFSVWYVIIPVFAVIIIDSVVCIILIRKNSKEKSGQ